VTFSNRIKILLGAALAAGLIGAALFGASTFQAGENPAARGDGTPIDIPGDNTAEIDLDGDDAAKIPFDNSAEIDLDGEDDAVGQPDGGDVTDEPDEPGEDPGEEPGKCDLDPEAEGCEPETPWNPDLDIVNPEDEKPDPPFPGNDLDIEAQPEDDEDPDPVPHPDFDIKTETEPTHVKIGKILGVNY
jgi:hypothetical protein